MLRLIIGGVTLAAVGYAMKEYCEDEGCPWDEPSYTSSTNVSTDIEEKTVMETSEISKKFHKSKKQYYKNSMKRYKAYLELYEIIDEDVDVDKKIDKEKFLDEIVDAELSNYIEQIIQTLKVLSSNLELKLRIFELEESKSEYNAEKIKLYAKHIFKLSHLNLFMQNGFFDREELDKEKILSTLVEAMPLVVNKETIHIDLKINNE